jgi:serine/threonine protein kinase/ABC-type transport system substrate-binding protein
MRGQVATGTVLAGFRVESLIGEGANGSVYLAERIGDGRRVALKLLEPELARDERFRRRFLRESQLAATLDHPHIVSTLASGEQDGHLYLVMAYVEGSDLRQVLRSEGRLGPERALDLIEQVAEALDAAHSAGLVHRDVKPANILVSTADGEQAYVCDFGLARHVSSVSSLTSDRSFVGTIDYVSPEQIEGGPIDGRADVYSLGCVLYECLAGERPFDRETELSVLFAHLNEPPAPLSDFRPELPGAIDAVFSTALAKLPDHRFATCGELVEAVRAALAGKTVPARNARRRRRVLACVAVVVAAAAAAGGVLATRGGNAPRSRATLNKSHVIQLKTNTLNLLDARTRRAVSSITLGRSASVGLGVDDIEFTGHSAWIDFSGWDRLERVDLASRKVDLIAHIPWGAGGATTPIGITSGSVWVAQCFGPRVLRIDGRTGKVTGRFTNVGQGCGGVVAAGGSVWVGRDAGVVELNERTGRLLRRIAFPAPVTRIVYADGAVWATSGSDGYVAKIDPSGGGVVTARLHGWLADLRVGGGSAWVSFQPAGQVFRLGESDLSVVATYGGVSNPNALSYGGGGLWISNPDTSTLSFLDPTTGRRTIFPLSLSPEVAVYHQGLLWTSGNPPPPPLPTITGQDLRISSPQVSTDADPSTGTYPADAQMFYETCANLLRYPDSAGPDGARLVPEIAAAMPTLSRDGRTYTFRIRNGFRFSPPSNQAVRAETFRHTIERALSPELKNPPGARFASDIVGEPAFRAGRAAHISGIRVGGSTLSITLLRPAGDFLERLSLYYFCPVPLTEKVVPSGLTGPVPTAGPYYQASVVDQYMVLLRNPNYHGDRPHRSARIVYGYVTPTSQGVTLADEGKVDLLPADFDTYSLLVPGGQLDRRFGPTSAAARHGSQRYFHDPVASVDLVVFNTARPLFHDVRLRRAVSKALDRQALAAALQDDAVDQLLPGSAPTGLRPLAVAPLPQQQHAVLYAACGTGKTNLPALIRSELARLRVAVSIESIDGCPQLYTEAARHADFLLAKLAQSPLRDGGDIVGLATSEGWYGSVLGPGPWTGRPFRRHLDAARALRGAARETTYRHLAAELMRAVPFVVFGRSVQPEFVSPKLGCLTFQAHYHFLDLGLLCKKG